MGGEAPVRAVLLDIEGTTTSIQYVYEVLFPYAREHAAAFLESRWDAPETREAVGLLRVDAADEVARGIEGAVAIPDDSAGEDAVRSATVAHVHGQMARDVKATGLKALQGLVWRAGYLDGTLLGHVYDDVPAGLHALRERGLPVSIYSSGSVAAQKLLFGHSVQGDLTPLLFGHFDTTTGPKRVASSYAAIAEALDVAPGEIVFATDVLAEAEAAAEVGVRPVLSLRPGNPPQGRHGHPTMRTFDDLVALVSGEG